MNDTTRRQFFIPVLDAMQSAEEMGGPEGLEYIALMDAIIAQATERKRIATNHWD